MTDLSYHAHSCHAGVKGLPTTRLWPEKRAPFGALNPWYSREVFGVPH